MALCVRLHSSPSETVCDQQGSEHQALLRPPRSQLGPGRQSGAAKLQGITVLFFLPGKQFAWAWGTAQVKLSF